MYSKISTDPGLLEIRNSHRFVAVVIQILIPYVDVTRQGDIKNVIKSGGHRSCFHVTMLTNTVIKVPFGDQYLRNCVVSLELTSEG